MRALLCENRGLGFAGLWILDFYYQDTLKIRTDFENPLGPIVLWTTSPW